jgi:cytochrome c peroxidase
MRTPAPAVIAVAAAVILGVVLLPDRVSPGKSLTPVEELGKRLFFDTNLSTPPGQSCATCHGLEVGFTGPDSAINASQAVYPGAVHVRFGDRKPPTAAYGGESPVLHYDKAEEVWIGGMFWDGRATGSKLGDPLAEQAQGPFLNPVEQNMADSSQVCLVVSRSSYAKLFEEVWGAGSLECRPETVAGVYDQIARSIAAYERSSEVNPFTSKYDYYLAGKAALSPQESAGLALYEDKGKCADCHPSQPKDGKPPLFTDFTFDNLGVPKNPHNPFYKMPRQWNEPGQDYVDYGLGGFLKKAGYPEAVYQAELGKQKVPTLRNVDKRPHPGFVKAYGHNGFFKSLEEIVHFYNTRDTKTWPAPEVPVNVNTEELGNLGLTPDEEAAIVAFLKTLSDGYVPAP